MFGGGIGGCEADGAGCSRCEAVGAGSGVAAALGAGCGAGRGVAVAEGAVLRSICAPVITVVEVAEASGSGGLGMGALALCRGKTRPRQVVPTTVSAPVVATMTMTRLRRVARSFGSIPSVEHRPCPRPLGKAALGARGGGGNDNWVAAMRAEIDAGGHGPICRDHR